MGLRLFIAPGSCAFAALVAFEAADANYEALRLDLGNGDQRSPQFRAINPLGRVPALMVDDCVVTELLAVLSYIDARYPTADLLSRDPLTRAREMQLLAWFSTSIHAHIAQIFRGERFSVDRDVQAKLRAEGIAQFSAELNGIEAACTDERSLYGEERFTLVNAFGLVIWRWAKRLEVNTGRFPNWARVVATDLDQPFTCRAVAAESAAPLWLETGTVKAS